MVKRISLKIIEIYQLLISPALGRNCRFYPSCSSYSLKVIEKYGFLKGLWFSLKRLSKCHPWHKGGINLP